MIKTIIFDYTGVITPTQDNYEFAKKHHKKFNMEPLTLMKTTYKNWDKARTGEISYKDYWKELSMELNADPDEIKSLMIETFPVDRRMMELIDKIHDKYTIVMLSDQVEDWIDKTIKENELDTKFHYFVNSYHVKAKKPEKKIFSEALRISESKADETLFIDDDQESINAARSLGMHTILFDSFEQFLKEFKKYINIA